MTFCSMFLFIFILSIFVSSSHGTGSDKITALPTQPKVGFKQYAGYVNIDVNNGTKLFYYFVEAENHPASKPVVLWLHGGPGCSAIGEGAFGQHGPFKTTIRGLVKNPFSRNREANMIYLDSPTGVGFSYSTNTSDYFFVDDETAGHYAPQLAELIFKIKANINLKGIAIGNPLLDFDVDYNSSVEFLKTHGQISRSTYHDLKEVCSYPNIRREYIFNKFTKSCQDVNTKLSLNVHGFTNRFNVIADKCPAAPENQKYLKQMGEKAFVCIRDATFAYMNMKKTQKALHAVLVGRKIWSACSMTLLYNPQSQLIPTISILGTLVKAGIRVLAFSGDQDSWIPFIGTELLIEEMAKDFGVEITRPHEAWFQGGQVAGWTQEYGNFLTFATIKGAGHSAGKFQPERTLVMWKAFLEGKPLPKRHPYHY
ncbi:serine carboxypeptidase-like 45 isoform X2 [Vicia villosa]|uniref:serine carboxypeptidase-like 45 isoform X2 n=1 Tax=Vicia villosa TaxID=3911 RepID=UPI00273BCC56|nr:serine carboxypeptidase-like 45 isoform X2 [Vicia villosa]